MHGSGRDTRVSGKTRMIPERQACFRKNGHGPGERHACFWKNTHGSGKDIRVSENHAWFRKRHACFRKNTHGSGKDIRVSEKPCMVPGETCVFLEKHAWFWKRHAFFWRNTHVFWKSSMFPEEQECIRLTAGIPHATK